MMKTFPVLLLLVLISSYSSFPEVIISTIPPTSMTTTSNSPITLSTTVSTTSGTSPTQKEINISTISSTSMKTTTISATTLSTTVSTTSATSSTQKGSTTKWFDIGFDTLYSIELTPATWDEAFEKCKLKGINGRLATVDSNDISLKLQGYMRRTSDKLWIGLRKDPSGTFKRIGNVESSYFNWDENQPNNYGNMGEDCVELRAWSMKWNDAHCSERRPYICASDNDPSLSIISLPSMTTTTISATVLKTSIRPSPFITPTGSTTELIDIGSSTMYSMERKPVTWDEASQMCKLKGINGRLATVDSVFISVKLQVHLRGPREKLWIGLRKDPSGTYKRTGNVESGFFNWDVNEPNNYGNVMEDCVELRTWNMKWNNIPCSEKRFYLCAFDKVQSVSTLSTTSLPSDSSVSNTALALNVALDSMSASSITLSDIAKECHATVILTSFLIVFVFLAFLVFLVLKRWPITPKGMPSDTVAYYKIT